MATSTDNLTLHRYKCTNKGCTEDLGDGVMLTLMLIPAGEFLMGVPEDEPDGRGVERPQHRVTVPQFLMGQTPVTQAQWRVVAEYDRVAIDLDPNPSQFKGDNLPVEQVNWYQAIEFCQRLAQKTQKNYHLPSEAQWEYACRAGTETAYHYGDNITAELANYSREVGQTTHVGMYPPNRWGIYDMHGNVEEWCQDYWHENYANASLGSQAWIEDGDSSRRVVRGSSWIYFANSCRSAFRYGTEPIAISDSLGFRVCCSAG